MYAKFHCTTLEKVVVLKVRRVEPDYSNTTIYDNKGTAYEVDSEYFKLVLANRRDVQQEVTAWPAYRKQIQSI